MNERADALVTQTTEFVLEPRIRRFPMQRYFGAAAGVLGLGLAAVVGVRAIATMDPILAAQGALAVRAVLYELPKGAELHVAIEPRTDVIRFVVHAYRRAEMSLSPRTARVIFEARGQKGSRIEELNLDAPGLSSRVTPEESGLSVGDPIPFEVDVHDLGTGELVVKLDTIAEADGLLVRAYRREQLSESAVTIRNAVLDRTRKDELARWTWELGWDELTAIEREAVLRTRWHKIGAMRGAARDLRSLPVAISPPPSRETPSHREDLLGRVPLRGDERIALLLRPGTKLRIASEDSTQLHLAICDAAGETETTTATAHTAIGPFEDIRSVEVGASRDVLVEVRASSALGVEWLGWNDVYRATPERPVLVASTDGARVVRVTVRRPMSRDDETLARLDARVDVSGPNLPKTVSRTFRATRHRSRVDRYDGFDAPEAPSERAAFYVALPRGATARIAPLERELDVSLSELDEAGPQLPLATRPSDAPPPTVIPETEDEPHAFVPRRPSNAAAFEPDARHVVRTAHWFAPAPPARTGVALGHAKHGNGGRISREGKPFETLAPTSFELESDSRRPLLLPIVAIADAPTTLTLQIEHAAAPAPVGLYTHWTSTRTMVVGAEKPTRATFVIGDDVPAGPLRVRIASASAPDAPSPRVLVHLPWAAVASRRAFGPRWIAGAFEE